MIRKKILLLMFCLSALLLVGCERVVDLTDEESQLIAEYAAELLLKYDINYEDRIDEGYQKAEEIASEELEEFINGETTELATQVASTETTEENQSQEATEISDEESQMAEEAIVGTESNIANIVGIEGADITFREYSILDQYPATDEQGEFIYLEAAEGSQLLVLRFDIVNKTEAMLLVSLIDVNVDYRVVCNGSKAAKPMLTILPDDLGTLETNVEPGASQEAVLVFQISDGMQQKLETMDLYVTYNDVDNMIKIIQ